MKNTSCVPHSTRYNMNARSQWKHGLRATPQNTRDRTLTMRQWDTNVRTPDTKPKLKTWVPGSEHHAPTWNKARRWESAQIERAQSCTLTWKRDMTGVSGLCHKTHEWHQTEVTEPRPPKKGTPPSLQEPQWMARVGPMGQSRQGSSMPGGQGVASSLAGSKGGPGRTGSLGGAGRARSLGSTGRARSLSLGWASRARSLGVKN